MSHEQDIEYLRLQLADYERKSRKTKWLLKQLFKKVIYFPRDLSAKVTRALDKRRARKGFSKAIVAQSALLPQVPALVDAPAPQQPPADVTAPVAETPVFPAQPAAQPRRDVLFFVLNAERSAALAEAFAQESAAAALSQMVAFDRSEAMHDLVRRAAAISPDVGSLHDVDLSYLSPWHDGDYLAYRKLVALIPAGPWDHVVMVPFGKMGGADFVSGVVARALSRRGRTLILRTDLPDWDRPDWYPQDVPAVDISAALGALPNRVRALYFLLRHIGARHVINVNSRLTFDMFVEYGERLAFTSNLHAYYFCADRDRHGIESGYPVWYFAPLLPFLTTAICDSADLAATVTQRYALPPALRAKVRTIYTPASVPVPARPLVEDQIASQAGRARPRVLWAGRLDRQKRFDILVALAAAMPDIQFDCWGKAVLDAPPKLSGLPANLKMHGAFKSFDDLPLRDCDGWLYTSEWDGLPTTLIELGAMGMPVVASAVGGVPELVDTSTGWPVDPSDGIAGYEAALRAMLADAPARRQRALALQARVAERHSLDRFSSQLAEVT